MFAVVVVVFTAASASTIFAATTTTTTTATAIVEALVEEGRLPLKLEQLIPAINAPHVNADKEEHQKEVADAEGHQVLPTEVGVDEVAAAGVAGTALPLHVGAHVEAHQHWLRSTQPDLSADHCCCGRGTALQNLQ